MADFQAIAQQFVQFYYETFDNNRLGLANLYKEGSMLTFEDTAVAGAQNILEKLQNLPFQKVEHRVATLDAQPTTGEGGILVLVTGALKVDQEEKPMSYTQVFQLQSDGAGSYYVFNDVFRLIYNAA